MYGRVTGVCLATALFICGVIGFPTPPSTVPAATGSLTMTQGAAGEAAAFTPGASISLKGGGFAADAAVTVAIYSQPRALAQTMADASGNLDVTVRLPGDLPTGRHTLVALGVGPDGSAVALTVPITVANGSGAAELAYTGFNVLAYLAGGVLLLVVGLVMLRTGIMRRRLVPVGAPEPVAVPEPVGADVD